MKPEVIHWAITSKCNLKCGFCFAFQAKDLKTSKCEEIIEKIANLGAKRLVITGGEPLLRKDIFQIIAKAKQKGFIVRLDTNGILLPRYRRDIQQLDAIGISLDGPNAEVDQLMRNHRDHFKNVIKSLEYLKDKKINVIVHTLVTRKNCDSIPALGQLLEKYQISKWSVFEFCPYARGFKNRTDFQLRKGQFNKIKSKIKYRGKIDFCSINDRVKAYFFICSDGSIYTQPQKITAEYPVWGNIFNDDPQRFFKEMNGQKNINRSRVF